MQHLTGEGPNLRLKTIKIPATADDDDEAEQAPCGTWLGEASSGTSNWAHVDCGLCLRMKGKISAAHEAREAAIVEQMGDMAVYMRGGIPTAELEAADASGFMLRK